MELLKGVRVIDLTSVLMGPYATQTLGDYGADVIKIEAPKGDVTRQIGPALNEGMGPVFLNVNRNKRSVALDLKLPAGRGALLKLAETADILLYNIRPQAMERLGLGYDVFNAINPRIIYAGVFGFGQEGPYAKKAAYDDLIQGASTIASLMTVSGSERPRYVPSAMADRVVGLFAVSGTLAALHRRNVTGKGTKIDFPMFETMVSFIVADHMGGLTFDPPLDRGGYARQLSPYRRPYKTSDGYICALIYTDKQWDAFARLMGTEAEYREDPRRTSIGQRVRHIDELYSELENELVNKTTAEWMHLLTEADIPVLPMHDLDTIFDDPHLSAIDFFPITEHPTEGRLRTIRFPAKYSGEIVADRPAPTYGEHGVNVMKEAGFTDKEIAELIDAGALGRAAPGA
jgi:crotonobetainyl-CoA:carnitine CoA-transferase CaiB-like acyl-CoA transferase